MLTESELQLIWDEAEKEYPDIDEPSTINDVDENDFYLAKRDACIETLAKERERTKGLIEVLEKVMDYLDNKADCDHDGFNFIPNKEMKLTVDIETALSNYQNKPNDTGNVK